MEYTFHFYNSFAETGAMMALSGILGNLSAPPVSEAIWRSATVSGLSRERSSEKKFPVSRHTFTERFQIPLPQKKLSILTIF